MESAPTVSRYFLTLSIALLLTACSSEERADPRADRDTAVSNALDDPIMADPDLASQSRNDSALSGGGPARAEIPPDKRTPEEAEQARFAARDLLGGAAIDPAPLPEQTLPESALAKSATMEAVAAALKLAPPQCPGKMSYTFNWAAHLPAALPIYPRGHARVAAGTDEAGCTLRAVRFASPVAVTDVMDFYYASARKAGLAPVRRREGQDDVVAGRGFAIYARQSADKMTEVDLVTTLR